MAKLLGFLISIFVILPIPLSAISLNNKDLIKQADSLYQRGDLKNYKVAIDLYLKVLDSEPDNFEANWKCARAHRDYGEEARRQEHKGWKKICTEYGRSGMQYSEKAIESEPNRTEGHFFYGLSVGTYSDGVSILTALNEGLRTKAQRSLERAYSLDKTYDRYGPILVLGRYWAILPWPFRNRKKALSYYREYEKTGHLYHREEGPLFLAEVLIELDKKGNGPEARVLLEKVAQSSIGYFRKRAKELLKKIGD